MYNVRCTIAIIARFARGFLRSKCERDVVKPCADVITKARGFSRSKCGRALMKLCAKCGVAFVVASPVGLCYNPTAGAATRQKKKMSNTITRRMQTPGSCKAAAHLRFTRYDVRCTIYDLVSERALRGESGQKVLTCSLLLFKFLPSSVFLNTSFSCPPGVAALNRRASFLSREPEASLFSKSSVVHRPS